MSRDFFRLEKGIAVTGENSNVGVHLLFGADVPGSIAQEINAEVGSIYQRTTGEVYVKKVAGSGADKWSRLADVTDIANLDFRSTANVLTANVEPGELGTIDFAATQYSDDDIAYLGAADHTLGDYILFGAGGTEVAYRVVDITGDVVTFSKDAAHATFPVQALAASDMFLVTNYLPDSPDSQEKQAIVQYNGSAYIKVGDVNWDLADGINLATGYAAASGDVTDADTVQSALQKIDGNVDAIEDAVGVAQGATDMGTYTGSIISDNQSAKENIQELEVDAEALQSAVGIAPEAVDMGIYTGTIISDNGTAKENIQELEVDVDAMQTLSGVAPEAVDLGAFTGGVIADNANNKEALQDLENGIEAIQTSASAAAVTTEVTLDSVLVDDVIACEYFITVSLDSNPAQRHTLTLFVQHDGTISADAANTDDTVIAKLKLGSNFNYDISVDLNGVTTAQEMRLRVSASAAVTFKCVRKSILF